MPLESEVTPLVSSNKKKSLEFNVESLVADPRQRPKILNYDPNLDELICKMVFVNQDDMIFYKHILGLFSVDLMLIGLLNSPIDDVFCLCCNLMKPDDASGDAFVKEGFSN
ncbi:hypothetical protein Ahy_B02g061018 [Arachis hypogaea]|uniref:Uncharacterized protein n=1 Tax=Arachis hypogaea TaxID=3818 RepID=A0A445AK06_ARAHY|nr:hypothetical protein Ahy_B02g061018 [Arachis hypogaea]